MWSVRPVHPSGLEFVVEKERENEGEKEVRRGKEGEGGELWNMRMNVWVLAFIVIIGVLKPVRGECGQQVAGSGGMGTIIGGVIVWVWQWCQ